MKTHTVGKKSFHTFDDAEMAAMAAGPEHDDAITVKHSDGFMAPWLRDFAIKLDKTKLGGKTPGDILDENGFAPVRELSFAADPENEYLCIAKLASKDDIVSKFEALQGVPQFIYAHPLEDHAHTHARWAPSDPGFGAQWQWEQVNAPAAWGTTRGKTSAGKPIRIAVIDRGFDLDGNFWTEIGAAAENGRSGAIDERTYAFKPGVKDASGKVILPAFGHGTFVAAQAGARAGNDHYGCGMAPECELMLVCAGTPSRVTQGHLAIAIAEAVDLGADIIVCAEGPSESVVWEAEPIMADAFDYAQRAGRGGLGTAVFWAVANVEGDLSRDEVIAHPKVIRVGRTDKNGRPVKQSATGAGLDFLAPGSFVWNIGNDHNFFFAVGNSFAAPIAAGIGALALAVNPQLTRDELYEVLKKSCDGVPVAGVAKPHGPITGYGLLNADKAVRNALAAVTA